MVSLVYPRGVPLSIKYPEMPLYAFMENSARKYPDRIAVIYAGNKIDYQTLWNQSLHFAAGLQKLGLKKNTRVGIILPNTPHFLVAYTGTLIAGGIVAPLNPLNPLSELDRELADLDCEILITLDRFLEKLSKRLPNNIIVGSAASYASTHLRILSTLRYHFKLPPGSIHFEELTQTKLNKEKVVINPREDVACILFTSGTTGEPKGVMLTHYNLVANALQSYFWLRGWGYSSKPQHAGWPIVLCAIPWFHSYGLNVLNEAVSYGCTLVLVPDPKPEAIIRAISENNVTHAPLIPRFVREVLGHQNLTKNSLKTLILANTGGGSVSPENMRRFEQIADCRFHQGYGLTEAGPATHATPIEGEINYLSAGLPYPDTEVRVVDLQLGEVEQAIGKEGELQIRGPQVMKGYWNAPEETMKVLKDGWLSTGDIAHLDSDGWLYVVGRKQERIIAAGHIVWPNMIEDLLKSHPAVEEAVAIGTPDPLRCSTDIQAFVVVKKGVNREGLENKLKNLCESKLESFAIPNDIKFLESLPITSMGKVDRRAVEIFMKEKLRELNTNN